MRDKLILKTIGYVFLHSDYYLTNILFDDQGYSMLLFNKEDSDMIIDLENYKVRCRVLDNKEYGKFFENEINEYLGGL